MKDAGNIWNQLHEAGKENPLSVPDGYFEHFPGRLQEALLHQSKKSDYKKSILTWKAWAAAAAILVTALIAGNIFFSQSSENKFNREIAQLVDEQLYLINEQTILEVMEIETDSTASPAVSSEEMIDYLINQNITENELLH